MMFGEEADFDGIMRVIGWKIHEQKIMLMEFFEFLFKYRSF